MPVNWNLLDTNAPAKVGASFAQARPIESYQKGKNQALAQQQAEQNLQRGQQELQGNQLAMRQQQARFPAQQQAAGIQNQTDQMDNAIKMNTIRLNAANQTASAPQGAVLQTAMQMADETARLLGADPTKAKQQIQSIFDQQGEDGLRRASLQQSLDAKSKLTAQTQQGQQQIQTGNLELGQQKLALEQQKFQQEQASPRSAKSYTPSTLGKMIDERQALVESGAALDSPEVVAYDSKISGTDIDTTTMSQDEIDTWGKHVALTGKVPSLGRGKSATKVRLEIIKSAARQSLGADQDGIVDQAGKTPSEAAFSMLGQQADTKSIQGSMNFLDKQVSSMGSFVENIGLQVDKVSELSKDLKTFDSRILNVPLRAVRGKIKGSALQAKYDMYLTEIEGEIGKLATGSAASIAELSTSAQEKWSNIHDKNLSIKDMMELLQETKKAAGMRLQSVENQLGRTRSRMVNREQGQDVIQPQPIITIQSDADYDVLKSGEEFMAPDGSRRRKP